MLSGSTQFELAEEVREEETVSPACIFNCLSLWRLSEVLQLSTFPGIRNQT